MPSRKLPNYLRTHRKRAGFSEEEIAFLLGLHDPGRVSRYEHFHSIPGLLTALAYHVIFKTSPPDIFGGKYQQVESLVRRRAKRLLKKLSTDRPDPRMARKLAWLRTLAGVSEAKRNP